MTFYTIQVSDHPEAGSRIPTAEAADSWKTVRDWNTSAPLVRREVTRLSRLFRHVRVFRGKDVGRVWYAILSTGEI